MKCLNPLQVLHWDILWVSHWNCSVRIHGHNAAIFVLQTWWSELIGKGRIFFKRVHVCSIRHCHTYGVDMVKSGWMLMQTTSIASRWVSPLDSVNYFLCCSLHVNRVLNDIMSRHTRFSRTRECTWSIQLHFPMSHKSPCNYMKTIRNVLCTYECIQRPISNWQLLGMDHYLTLNTGSQFHSITSVTGCMSCETNTSSTRT